MVHTLFFDLDNTLYPKSSKFMDAIRCRIIAYMSNVMKMNDEDITAIRKYSLERYGTTMIGLVELFGIDQQEYLDYVHDLDLRLYLKRDLAIARTLANLPQRKVIFSNADCGHILRVLDFLGLGNYFDCFIDVQTLMPNVKPQAEAFQKALIAAGLTSWEGCAFIDDHIPNIQAGRQLGIFSILIDEESSSSFTTQIRSPVFLSKLLSSHEENNHAS